MTAVAMRIVTLQGITEIECQATNMFNARQHRYRSNLQ